MGDFAAALKFTLGWEGGFVNDPDDPGGRTNKGITERVYRAYLGDPSADVAHISDTDVAAIYHRDYWQKIAADVPDPLALVAFDTAVNCGVSRTRNWMLEAGGSEKGIAQVTRNLLALRARHYDRLVVGNPKLAKFLGGWRNRLTALAHAAGQPKEF